MELQFLNVTETKNVIEDSSSFIQKYLGEFTDWLARKALLVIIAFLFIFICSKIIKWILRIVKRSFERAQVDKSVSGFALSFLRIALYTVLFISSIAFLGFEVTTLVTVFGAGSITIGLALQGSLSNLAGGVLILILKPFVVGDYIIENDKNCEGTVVSIDIFYTKLKTPDNKIIVIPNGNISANSLVNLTSQINRRVDINVNVSYNTDIKALKNIVATIINESEYILEEEPIDIFIDSFGNNGMKIVIRYWVKTENYWLSKWDSMEKIKNAFDENNITIPFDQLEVKIKN